MRKLEQFAKVYNFMTVWSVYMLVELLVIFVCKIRQNFLLAHLTTATVYNETDASVSLYEAFLQYKGLLLEKAYIYKYICICNVCFVQIVFTH